MPGWHEISIPRSLRGLFRDSEEVREVEDRRDQESAVAAVIRQQVDADIQRSVEAAASHDRSYSYVHENSRTPSYRLLNEEYINHLIDERLKELGLYPHLRQQDGRITINGEATINRDTND